MIKAIKLIDFCFKFKRASFRSSVGRGVDRLLVMGNRDALVKGRPCYRESRYRESRVYLWLFELAFVFVLYIEKLHYYFFNYASKFTTTFWIAFRWKYFVKPWIRRFVQSSNMSFVVEPIHRWRRVNNDELKAIVESDTSQSTHELASKFGVSIPTILDHLPQIKEVKKLDRWVLHELNAHQTKRILMFAFFCFRGIKESLFCIVSLLVMKNGFSMIIVSVQQAD